ncbi:MAG: type II toxin-antitoxin system VapC family toxin [Thermodesulfobacteriota bacterium]
MGVKPVRFAAELRRVKKVGLDTSILIYHLEDIEPYADLTEVTFSAIAEGLPRAVLSTISMTELLVQPFAAGENDRITIFEQLILSLPNTDLIPPDYAIAKDAARLRSKYAIRTPDALLISTALAEKAEAFLTNDSRLRSLKAEGISVLVLDDFL